MACLVLFADRLGMVWALILSCYLGWAADIRGPVYSLLFRKLLSLAWCSDHADMRIIRIFGLNDLHRDIGSVSSRYVSATHNAVLVD